MVQTPEEIRDRMRELQRIGRSDEAIAICTAAMSEIGQEHIHRLLDYRASAKWRVGHREDALADMEAAITAAPQWAGHLYQYMLWCVELGLFNDAVKASKQLVIVETERASDAFMDSAHFFQSFALLQLGDWEGALASARSMKDEKPIWVSGRFVSKSELIEAAAKNERI